MSLENLKSATREKIYQHLREIFEEMDIVEALDSLEHRLYALRDRASRNLKAEPLKEEAKAESKTLAFNSLKSRTDELSRSSIHVLKHYAQMNPSDMTSAELQFYRKYVLPVIHLLK